jgi:hypothetical protein
MAVPTLSVEMYLGDPLSSPPATITFDNLGSSTNPDVAAASGTSLSNSSWTPPTSGLIILYVFSRAATAPNTPTVTGNGITWTQIATVPDATPVRRLTLFGANASGTISGVTTADFAGQSQTSIHMVFMHAADVDLSGGVAAAFVQAPTGTATGTSASITLAAAGNSGNRPIAGYATNVTITPRTNWTEMDEMPSTGAQILETQQRPDAFESTSSATWDGASRTWVGIAAELKVSPGGDIWSDTANVTDLTPYVRSWSTQRGTQRELQRVEAGTASIVLDNRSGRFTPQNTSSPYYPNLLPMRQIRIRGTWNSVTYPIFQGFVEAWPATFPSGVDQIVTLSLVDGFKLLSLAAVSGSFSQQGSGARVAAILDAVGWPTGDRTITTGESSVPAISLTNTSALQHLQEIEHAEGGRLFMGRDGKVNFIGRYDSLTAPNFSDRIWTDDGSGSGAMSYRDIALVFDDQLIVNDARLARTGGTQQVAVNSTSQTRYGTRSLVESDIQLTTDNEVLDFANEVLGKYAEPVLRIEGLEDNALGHEFWGNVLGRELRDRVLIIKHPMGSSTLSQDSYIEGLAHEAPGGGEWRTTLRVSPVDAEAWFVWGTSRWGVDTRWGR